MRPPVDASRLRRLMQALGAEANEPGRVYLVGGACAVLHGWRETTVDVDLKIVPELDRIFRAIPRLKEQLGLNVELAAPSDFIPELKGWQDRSPFIATEGRLAFHHYDFHAQVLSKIERGHGKDLLDVREMFARGLADPARVLRLFGEIEPLLHRYPALNAKSFRQKVETTLAPHLAQF